MRSLFTIIAKQRSAQILIQNSNRGTGVPKSTSMFYQQPSVFKAFLYERFSRISQQQYECAKFYLPIVGDLFHRWYLWNPALPTRTVTNSNFSTGFLSSPSSLDSSLSWVCSFTCKILKQHNLISGMAIERFQAFAVYKNHRHITRSSDNTMLHKCVYTSLWTAESSPLVGFSLPGLWRFFLSWFFSRRLVSLLQYINLEFLFINDIAH